MKRKTINTILFILGSSAMISAFIGIVGGILFDSIKLFGTGLGIMFLCYILFLILIMYDLMIN